MKFPFPLPLAFLGLCSVLQPAAGWSQTVLFREDFDGTTLDRTRWSVATWKLGQTRFGNTPLIADGVARLTFDTEGLKGTEIDTKTSFTLGTGLEFETRMKLNPLPSGLVCAAFTYQAKNGSSDEIDFEILTKQLNLQRPATPVLCSAWNDWREAVPVYNDGKFHHSQTIPQPELDANEWHTWTIRWLPDQVIWLVDGKEIARTTQAVPDAPTPFRLNLWAPSPGWTEAYDPALKSTTKEENQRYFMDIDWVEVRQTK